MENNRAGTQQNPDRLHLFLTCGQRIAQSAQLALRKDLLDHLHEKGAGKRAHHGRTARTLLVCIVPRESASWPHLGIRFRQLVAFCLRGFKGRQKLPFWVDF